MISLHPIHHHPSIHSKFAEFCISQNTGQSDSQNLFNPPNLSKSAFSQFFWQLTYPTPKITSPKPGKTYVTNNIQIISSFSHTNGYRHFNLQITLSPFHSNPIQKGRASLGHVAVKNMVCRLFGTCCKIRWIWGSKPMSNIRSASSKTCREKGVEILDVSICFPWCDRMSLWVGFYDDLGVFQDSFK